MTDDQHAARSTAPSALRELTTAKARDDFQARHEFLFVADALPAAVSDALAAEAAALGAWTHRAHAFGVRKGGSISHQTLLSRAPVISGLYRLDALRDLVSHLAGAPVVRCPDDDPHASALYVYTEPGDYVGFHYDTSWYRGARYTVLVGVTDRSTSRLLCALHHRSRERRPETLSVATAPGSLVVFNGDRLYHAVSPLGADEERIVLSMEFVTDPRMNPVKRLVSKLKDAAVYFGFKSVFGGR